jgi:hypothetical protein
LPAGRRAVGNPSPPPLGRGQRTDLALRPALQLHHEDDDAHHRGEKQALRVELEPGEVEGDLEKEPLKEPLESRAGLRQGDAEGEIQAVYGCGYGYAITVITVIYAQLQYLAITVK